MSLTARAFKYGDDINTDYIISGKYKFKSNDMEEMAHHAMEELDPDYYAKVKPEGGFLVAGTNFGMGSSREQAPLVLIHSNTKAILAKSFARIFYRNAINTGLPILEAPEAVDGIRNGDVVTVDADAGTITNETSGQTFTAEPFPPFIKDIIEQGGLIERARASVGGEVAAASADSAEG